MFNIIKKDISRYKSSDSLRGKIRILRNNHGFKATLVYRYGQWIRKLKSSLVTLVFATILYPSFYLLDKYIQKAYGIIIHKDATIGEGFLIYHLGGIVIGPYLIGNNLTVHQHVKIGSLLDTDNKKTALGDNVWIGPHGIINSGVIVGNNVVIQAGSVIVSDVNNSCLMTGNPARVVRINYDNPELFKHYS